MPTEMNKSITQLQHSQTSMIFFQKKKSRSSFCMLTGMTDHSTFRPTLKSTIGLNLSGQN